ncbi:hypothetical protein [Streptomyces sp. YIM 98790]|uniref:hypothetical protein n=1 Tax=Streptomyces sp. YIM 98790 TaxID=2689077 RepID=UPI00140A4CF6|nr:hypothetical protein [Streptomyces sp. YIM 98790]
MTAARSARRTRALRAAAVAAVAAALTMALPTAAQARHADVTRQFAAEHKDDCLNSATGGRLIFKATHPPQPPAVEVTGRVALIDPGLCFFLVPPTAEATFTAYSGRTVVDSETVVTTRGDAFSFVLTPDWSTGLPSPIDRVVLRLCHGSALSDPPPVESPGPRPANCAAPVTYTPSDFGTTH